MRAGVIQQRPELGDRNRDVGLQGIGAEEVIEQAAHRAFLERGAGHVARRAKGVLAFAHIVEQRLGQRRRNGVDVFRRVLLDALRDIVRRIQAILEEIEHHAHFMQADVEGGVGIDKGVQRQVFVQLVDLAAQLQAVIVPVKDHAADAGIGFDQLQQVTAVFGVYQLESHRAQRRVELADRLIFVVDARRAHDGDNIHRQLLSVNGQVSITPRKSGGV
ncbi:Uncharacterised protein [Acinetobacter baumannii]|nr:Uncharacterised protein [Acinetobacter baumannii]